MTRTTVQLQAHDMCNCTTTAQIRAQSISFKNFDIVMIINIIELIWIPS